MSSSSPLFLPFLTNLNPVSFFSLIGSPSLSLLLLSSQQPQGSNRFSPTPVDNNNTSYELHRAALLEVISVRGRRIVPVGEEQPHRHRVCIYVYVGRPKADGQFFFFFWLKLAFGLYSIADICQLERTALKFRFSAKKNRNFGYYYVRNTSYTCFGLKYRIYTFILYWFIQINYLQQLFSKW